MANLPDDSRSNRLRRHRFRAEVLSRIAQEQNRAVLQSLANSQHQWTDPQASLTMQDMQRAYAGVQLVAGSWPPSPFGTLAQQGLLGGIAGKGGDSPFAMPIGTFTEFWPDTSEWNAKEITGELVGWRAWKFENGQLKSPYRDQLWKPNATIKADSKPSESRGGIYAHKTRDRLEQQESDWTLIGTVLLWGDVVEHEHGYRGEFAKLGQIIGFAENMSESFKAWLKAEFSNQEYPQV